MENALTVQMHEVGRIAALSIELYGLPTKTETQTFCLTRATSDTITNAKVQVHAIGRWK